MRNKLIVPLLLAVCGFSIWRIAVFFMPPGPVDAVSRVEETVGERLCAGLEAGRTTGIVVVVSESFKGTAFYNARMQGIVRQAGRMGIPAGRIAVERWTVDPLDEQAGMPSIRVTDVLAMVDRNPGCNGVLGMLDVGYPALNEQDELRKRNIGISLIAYNDALGRQLFKSGFFRTVILPKVPGAPASTPAAEEDEPISAGYEVLRKAE